MRAFDVAGVGLGLVVVPLFAWLLGRFCGRRNWPIGGLLAAAILTVLAIQAGILAGQSLIEARAGAGRDLLFLFGRRATEAATNPEFPLFLVVLGIFVTMLGWSATPARKRA